MDEAHIINNPDNEDLLKLVATIRKKYFLLLSATPIQRSLDDLYSIVSLLRPGHFNEKDEFLKKFQDPSDERKIRKELVPELQKHLSNVMIRNTRSEVDLEFPTRQAVTVKVPLASEHLEFYRKFQTRFSDGLKGKDNQKFLMKMGRIVEGFCSSQEAFDQQIAEVARHRGLIRQLGSKFFDDLKEFANNYPDELVSQKADLAIKHTKEHTGRRG